MAKISVIIPVYNTEKYLAECLDSVIAQTFQDIEIICIDDGSTDNSAKILTKYAKQDSRIKVLTQKNSGVIIARNNGIAHATANLIYPLDSDDKIATETLQELYNAFMQHRGDVITSMVEKFGEEFGTMVLPKPTKLNFCNQNCAVNAALFRKSDFIAAGGYDPTYSIALEDYDLWLNFIYRQNLKFYRVHKKLFFYRIKPESESRNEQHRNQHAEIVKSFLVKYPQIKRYKMISKLFKPFNKIVRFVFRIQDNKIKIFKIPVLSRKHGRLYVLGIRIPIVSNTVKRVYYFDCMSNFGDQLNPVLLKLFGYKPLHTNPNNCKLVAIGSLMELFFSETPCKISKKQVIVYGTGFIQQQTKKLFVRRVLDVRAVRGYSTLERLKGINGVKISPNVVIGDPGLLSALLINKSQIKKKYKLGIIPHYVDQNNPLLSRIRCKNSTIIDITQSPEVFMKKIAECENIISSAMHGLIAADSLGTPNIRMILSDNITGGDYKYNDYYSAFGITKHNRIDLRKESFTEKDLEYLKHKYQIKPEQVKQKQQELLKAFPYKIKGKICL